MAIQFLVRQCYSCSRFICFLGDLLRSKFAASNLVNREYHLDMPSFAQWLKASWDDFRRRWAVLIAVAGAASFFGAGPAWAVWGLAGRLP